MNVLIGTDIIEINRIKKALKNEKFLKRIYTENEIKYCEEKGVQKYQSYAGKFSAKEAVYKALNTKIDSFKWTDIEILNDENGKPYINFLNTDIEGKIEDIDISISHCKEYAIASVVLILKNK